MITYVPAREDDELEQRLLLLRRELVPQTRQHRRRRRHGHAPEESAVSPRPFVVALERFGPHTTEDLG